MKSAHAPLKCGEPVLAMSLAGFGVAPAASAVPYCDFLDIAGLCDVRDAVKACNAYPEECER